MTAKQALAKLRKARDLDLRGWTAHGRAQKAIYNHGTYSRHQAAAEKHANEAAALFLEVERYLESLT